MSTNPLPAALAIPGRYAVESTWVLAEAVRRALKERTGIDADVRPVPELVETNMRSGVTPLGLLLGLGKTTSALPGLQAAGAGGLPGLSALRTASRWAIIRYLWAFSDDRPALRLSELTDQVRYHQRTLLSEHFGIAVATDLVEQLILDRPAQVVDADAVTYDSVLRSAMAGLGAHKPDYFWYCQDGTRLSDVIVVEVKGTSSGRRASLVQLARGVEQVLVPSLVPGTTMRRIVIGAGLSGGRVTAFAVEVGEPDISTRQHAFVELRIREGDELAPTERHAQQDGGDRLDYFDDEVDDVQAARDVLYLDQARLHTFTGLAVTAEVVRENPQSIRNMISSLESVQAGETVFRCENTRIALGTQYLSVRTGVVEEFLISTEQYESAQRLERRARYQARHEGNRYTLMTGRSTTSGRELPMITSPDGCMLSVSIEEASRP
jgi:hypothetical protein